MKYHLFANLRYFGIILLIYLIILINYTFLSYFYIDGFNLLILN